MKDYKGDATASVGEAFDPSPANIESRTSRGQLRPGIKVSLLPKKTRGATVVAQLRLNYGDENSLRQPRRGGRADAGDARCAERRNTRGSRSATSGTG